MTAKQKTDNDPAAAVENARDELQAAQNELQAFDIHKGGLNEAASRRRELSERVEIAKERLTLAQSRFDESEFARIENEIAELQADAQQVENELQIAREQAAADLRRHLNPDFLDGRGRFSTQRPAIGELLGYCNSVNEVAQRLDSVRARIGYLERKIADRRQERSRQAAAERVDRRRKLISGEVVEVPLTPWKIIPATGFTGDVADSLERRAIPCALPDPRQPEIHALLPPDSKPHNWADGFQIESAEPMDATALCPALAGVWSRATPSKKRAAR